MAAPAAKTPMWLIASLLFLALAATAVFWLRHLRRCQHRFGVPVSQHVRCMKCYRRYRIEATPAGEWRIARHPEIETHPSQLTHLQ